MAAPYCDSVCPVSTAVAAAAAACRRQAAALLITRELTQVSTETDGYV